MLDAHLYIHRAEVIWEEVFHPALEEYIYIHPQPKKPLNLSVS